MTIGNAYQVAVAGGFPGTEAQWLASLSIRSRIMFALADLLQGAAPEGESDIPWLVDNPGSRRPQLFLDASRVAGPGDWVVIDLGMEGEGLDQPGDTCRVISSLPVVVTISMPRQPGDPPNWQLLDPFYVAVHGRVMGGTDFRQPEIRYRLHSEQRVPRGQDAHRATGDGRCKEGGLDAAGGALAD